jgi:hypothetical protein
MTGTDVRAEAEATDTAVATNEQMFGTGEAPVPQDNLRFIGNIGLTGGGSTLYTVQDSNGSTQTIRAGTLFELGGGILWNIPDRPLSLQMTANWHGDSAGTNSSASFSRYPLEALAYFHPDDTYRFGMGVRYVLAPVSNAKISGGDETIHFKNALGVVLEAGYRFDKDDWVNLRVVREQYQPDSCLCGGKNLSVQSSPSVNGLHVGVNWVFHFGGNQASAQSQPLPAAQEQQEQSESADLMGLLINGLFDGLFGVPDDYRTHDDKHHRRDDRHEDKHKDETVTRNIVITPDPAK